MLQTKRLLKLADHLEYGKLGHDKFDFGTWNDGPQNCSKAGSPEGCGTSGCAIGECPIVFPKDWDFVKGSFDTYYPKLKDNRYNRAPISDSGVEFFGITYAEFEGLFTPGGFNEAVWNRDTSRNRRPGKREVARGIRRFIRYKFAKAGIEYVAS